MFVLVMGGSIAGRWYRGPTRRRLVYCTGWPDIREREERTVPSFCAFRPAPSASYPTMRAISCTRVWASLGPVFADRSWESLAWRHGWEETCAFLGRLEEDIVWVCFCSDVYFSVLLGEGEGEGEGEMLGYIMCTGVLDAAGEAVVDSSAITAASRGCLRGPCHL
jgi:hypothetical protein